MYICLFYLWYFILYFKTCLLLKQLLFIFFRKTRMKGFVAIINYKFGNKG